MEHVLVLTMSLNQGRGKGDHHTLPHDHTAHKHLDRPDPLQWHFPLARGLIQTELMPQLILGDRVWVVDLVAEDEKGHFC